MKLRELFRLLAGSSLWQGIRRRSIFQSICPFHDMDRVNEKLGCNPGFFLASPKTKQSQSGYDYDRGICVPQFRRVLHDVGVIIFFVVDTVATNGFLDELFELANSLLRIPRKIHGTNSGS